MTKRELSSDHDKRENQFAGSTGRMPARCSPFQSADAKAAFAAELATGSQAVLTSDELQEQGTVLYVSTKGNDAWSRKQPHQNAGNTDGPVASLAKPPDPIRQPKSSAHL